MTVRIKGHFDGSRVVLDESVEMAAGTPVTVEVSSLSTLRPVQSAEERLAPLDRMALMAVPGLKISDESLLRENLYED